MLYQFLLNFVDNFGFLNVFKYLTFRTGLSFFTSLIIVLIIGGPFIKFFSNQKILNPIRDDGPEDHIIKKIGTPTMGGLIILLGLFILLDPNKGISGGDIVTLGCAISFAIHIILQDIYLRKGANVLKFFTIQVLFVSLFSFISSLIVREDSIVFSNDVIIALLVTGILATFVAFILMLWAQTILSATETGILLSLEPLFAALYSVLIMHKSLGFNGWIGGLIIIAAVISSNFISSDKKNIDNNV